MLHVSRSTKETIRTVKWKPNARNRSLDNSEYNAKCCKPTNHGGTRIYHFYNAILDLGYELRFLIIDKPLCLINKYFNYISLLQNADVHTRFRVATQNENEAAA